MANHAPSPAYAMRVPTLAQGGTRNDNAQEEETEKMWKTSLDHISEDDKWIMDAWVGDANGILAFTGLLSATIGAFIIEFYKTLSPDSGGQTVVLLGQISQQLTGSRNGTSITAANQPFSPNVYMIWANAMWLISLVFSLTSALITALNQQAVRRYIETPKVPSKPNDRARVHLLLFRGIKLYKMPLAILAAPALLHLSIWLFFGGLVIVFHIIYEKVAIALDVAVGVSGLVYMAMSLLPLLDFKCPYRTPITYLLWYLWHAFLSFAAYCGLLLFGRRLPVLSCLCPCPCGCPVPLDSDSSDGSDKPDKPDSSDGVGLGNQYILPVLSNSLGKAVKEQRRYLTDGFPKSVINDATDPLEDEDRKTITWLFRHLSLGDKNKFLVFAASIPRYKVIDLIPPIKSGKFVLRQPLLILFRRCTDDTSAVGPGDDVREGALLTCLTAIHEIAKAPSIPNLNFVRREFANISRMRVLWNDNDNSIRITSRSICALVARQVVRKRRIEDADLSWLQEVTGEPSNAILEADVVVQDLINFKSFVYGALPDYSNHLSAEDATSFNETLAILLGVRTDDRIYFTTPDWQTRLSEEIGRVQQYDPEGGREVFDKLHSVFPSLSATPSVNIAPSIYREAPTIQTPSIYRETPTYQAPSTYRGVPTTYVGAPIFPRAAPSIYRDTPSIDREAREIYRDGHETYRDGAPEVYHDAPEIYHDAPSFHAEASFSRESPFVHHEGISPALVPSPPAPRPRRASRSSQVTRPPLVPPSPSPRAVPPPRATSPPRIISPPRAVPPPHAAPSPSPALVPTPSAPRPRRVAYFSPTTRPSLITPPPREVLPPRAALPPRIISPPHAVPPPRAAPSPPVVHYPPGRAIPPPQAVFAPYGVPSRAAPSAFPSAVPSPSVPPTPRAASPSRTTRRSHTARPPHAPV